MLGSLKYLTFCACEKTLQIVGNKMEKWKMQFFTKIAVFHTEISSQNERYSETDSVLKKSSLL